MNNKKAFYIFGGILCLLAVIFTAVALTHPELSFPWPNWVSYSVYALYVIYTVLVFCMPKFKNPSLAVCGIVAALLAAIALIVIFIGTRKTPNASSWYLIAALFLTFSANLANFALLKKGKREQK